MTLIIGFVNHAGIAIVSDTMITNTETMEPSYSKKILTPLKETPFLVGAAGYTNLFQEFNRKIPEVVEQRLKQYKILNIQELMKVGYSREEAIVRVQLYEKNLAKTQAVQETEEKIEVKDSVLDENIIPPFVYSGEDFLDDCRSKIKEITSEINHPNPLELLIGQKRKGVFPSLFYVSPSGRVEQIWTYSAIGSGQPYVKMFFDRLYDFNKSMDELITHAFRAIIYTKVVAKENSVGYSDDFPPEALVIFNNDEKGNYGFIQYNNTKQVLQDIEEEMRNFENIITVDKKTMLRPTE